MPTIIIASGTSTSGKSSIARVMREYGYEIISLDDVFEETRPDINKNMYMDDLNTKNPDRKEMCKRVRAAYRAGKDVFVDEVFGNLLTSQLDLRKYKVVTVLVYAPLAKLLENYNSRKLRDYRSMRGILEQYRSLYTYNRNAAATVDHINKTNLYQAANADHRSFSNQKELKEFIEGLATDMGLPKRTSPIAARGTYDLIVINDTTPEEAAKLIHEFVCGI